MFRDMDALLHIECNSRMESCYKSFQRRTVLTVLLLEDSCLQAAYSLDNS